MSAERRLSVATQGFRGGVGMGGDNTTVAADIVATIEALSIAGAIDNNSITATISNTAITGTVDIESIPSTITETTAAGDITCP